MSTTGPSSGTGRAAAGKREVARIARRTRLLDAAERRFAEVGYEATVLRDVTSIAGTRLSSVTDDFGGKESLFREVVLRRAIPLEQQRMGLLAQAPAKARRQVRLEAIVGAYIDPMLERAEESEGWRYYFQFIAQVTNSRNEIQATVADDYNRSARQFIDALHLVYPAAADRPIYESYLLMLASALQVFSESPRLAFLSQGRYRSEDLRRRCALMKKFVTGGIHTILDGERGAGANSQGPG